MLTSLPILLTLSRIAAIPVPLLLLYLGTLAYRWIACLLSGVGAEAPRSV